MIKDLPGYISLIFGCTTVAGLFLFVHAIKKSPLAATRQKSLFILLVLTAWLILQAVLSVRNIYNSNTDTFPPVIILLGILPVILTIIILFSTSGGRVFIDSLPLRQLTFLHIIRIPVEIVLYWLFLHKAVPELMTFEGRNIDITAGVTAPFVAWFAFKGKQVRRKILLAWNFICLALLLNIVITALLAAPSPIQKIAFDQPNIAVLHFPFSWLPVFIVPLVLFAHLTSIRQLLKTGS